MLDQQRIQSLVDLQLSSIADPRVADAIRQLLVVPREEPRPWDYGLPDHSYACWMVLEHAASNTGICYCAQGFGPKSPWGLLFLKGPHKGMGMDSSWFQSLEEAFRDSHAFDLGSESS